MTTNEKLRDALDWYQKKQEATQEFRDRVLTLPRGQRLCNEVGEIAVSVTTRRFFDTQTFKREHPDLYAAYLKDSEPFVRTDITLKHKN